MKKIFIFHLVAALWALAANSFSPNDYAGEAVVLKESGKFFEFRLHKRKKYLLSSNCFNKKFGCKALKFFLVKQELKMSKIGNGGRNTGEAVCIKLNDAEVINFTNKLGNSVSICRFDDGSMISSGILKNNYPDN